MASVNKAILIGNLGKDPELRYTPTGVAVCTFSIATTEKWRDKTSNEMKESTTWHNIVLWRRQAEIAKEYLSKGSPVYIEGRIQTRTYDDKEGQKRWITEIVGDRLQLLGRRGETADVGSQTQPVDVAHEAPPLSEEDDDLPF